MSANCPTRSLGNPGGLAAGMSPDCPTRSQVTPAVLPPGCPRLPDSLPGNPGGLAAGRLPRLPDSLARQGWGSQYWLPPAHAIMESMLTRYIREAMKRARYKTLADGACFGEIPGLSGVWASEHTMERCREVVN